MLSDTESGKKGLKPALSELVRELVPPNIAHELRVDGDESLVPPLGRDHLFLAVREAVRNTVAYSGARRIGVELSVTGERVVGVVEDDGRGLDPEKVRREGFLGGSPLWRKGRGWSEVPARSVRTDGRAHASRSSSPWA